MFQGSIAFCFLPAEPKAFGGSCVDGRIVLVPGVKKRAAGWASSENVSEMDSRWFWFMHRLFGMCWAWLGRAPLQTWHRSWLSPPQHQQAESVLMQPTILPLEEEVSYKVHLERQWILGLNKAITKSQINNNKKSIWVAVFLSCYKSLNCSCCCCCCCFCCG